MKKSEIIISGKKISSSHSPYIVAEVSANHNGKIETAFDIVEAAKKCGADAVKLQTYTADTITLKSDSEDFKINSGLWKGRTLYDLYEEAHTPWEWHKPLFEHAHKIGITIFSSPFDSSAVDFLETLNTPAYKIASFEVVDIPLIKYVASTGKPMIISTGLASIEEIEEAIDAASSSGCRELALLHCVSGYPVPPSDYNLKTILDMKDRFGLVTGLSDHTLGTTTAITSVALGASIIEKHFTLDRNGGGPDDSFSLEPTEMRDLCVSAMDAFEALGQINYDHKGSEKSNVIYRRSLYFVKDLQAGEVVTSDAIRSVRPGYGLAPKYKNEVVGRVVSVDVKRSTAVSWDHLL